MHLMLCFSYEEEGPGLANFVHFCMEQNFGHATCSVHMYISDNIRKKLLEQCCPQRLFMSSLKHMTPEGQQTQKETKIMHAESAHGALHICRSFCQDQFCRKMLSYFKILCHEVFCVVFCLTLFAFKDHKNNFILLLLNDMPS